MEFFRNITAPELGVSPIGIDVQAMPNLSTQTLISDTIKKPIISADLLNRELIPYIPNINNYSDDSADSGSVQSFEPETDTPPITEKTTEQVNYYYPQGSNTPVYTTPSVTPVVIEGNVVGLSKTTKTLLTVGGIVAALFILGVFKNSNVIK